MRSCILLVCALFSTTLNAEVTATVDRNTISEFDLLTLTIRVSGGEPDRAPDFSPLSRDFDIVNTQNQQSSSISFINGRQTSSSRIDYVLTLRAKRLGRLTIPPIRVGSEVTTPIPIRVAQPSAAETRRMNRQVFFDTVVDTKNTYVQAQVLYTVRLLYSESISGDFPPPPQLEDAVIETIESEKRYETTINNRRYFVLEKQYAIFPQKSGVLVIPRETFVGTRGQRSLFSQRERISAASEQHLINVQTIPRDYRGEDWIPAKQLSIGENWAEDPVFRVGEPVNRILTMSATGLAASLLPPFADLKLDNAKTYADPPDSSERAGEEGIIATNTTTIGIVPIKEGKLTLPEIRISWWNTTTDKQEVATIPEATYMVLPAIGSVSVAPTIPVAASKGQTQSGVQSTASPYWMIASAVLGLMWLLTGWQWWSVRSRLAKLETEQEAPQPLFETPDENRAFKNLSKACKANNASNAHRQLFIWGNARFSQIECLKDLQQLAASETFSEALTGLEKALYSPGDQGGSWQGSELLKAATALRNMRETEAQPTALLGGLNPV
jgi:hypothetical protein|tara:strand:+ start:6946 stop:8610 length:1665 start_codon:yes stop_codon:yes gene_type:complete